MPTPVAVHTVHHLGIKPRRDHQQKPPTIQLSEVNPAAVTGGNQSGHSHATDRNAQPLGEDVFGPNGEEGERQAGVAIDEVGDRAISARRNEAEDGRPLDGIGQPGIEPGT